MIPDTGLLSTASAQPLPQVFKTLSKFPTPLQFLLTDFSTPFQVSHIFSAPSSNLSATACLCSGSKAALLKKKCQIFSMPDYSAFRMLVKAASRSKTQDPMNSISLCSIVFPMRSDTGSKTFIPTTSLTHICHGRCFCRAT